MLNKKYQSAGSVIATYDNYDFAEGTGIVNFRGFKYDVSGSTVYGLSNQDNYSYSVETSTATADTTPAKRLDLDFDLTEFESPKTIKGTAIVSVPLGVDGNTAGGSTTGFIIAKIRKWDGTTETEIASGTSTTEAVNSGTINAVKTIKVDIPITSFKVGDTLRLTIEGWGKHPSGFEGYIAVGHDPQNRDGTYITPTTNPVTTKLNFYCPFRLEEA